MADSQPFFDLISDLRLLRSSRPPRDESWNENHCSSLWESNRRRKSKRGSHLFAGRFSGKLDLPIWYGISRWFAIRNIQAAAVVQKMPHLRSSLYVTFWSKLPGLPSIGRDQILKMTSQARWNTCKSPTTCCYCQYLPDWAHFPTGRVHEDTGWSMRLLKSSSWCDEGHSEKTGIETWTAKWAREWNTLQC